MKIKTCELEKSALNWAVAKCEGHIDNPDSWLYQALETDTEHYYPSTRWSIAGPIIEREGISLKFLEITDAKARWVAKQKQTLRKVKPEAVYGQTPLEAAMRCYVSLNLGEEVEIPDELLES